MDGKLYFVYDDNVEHTPRLTNGRNVKKCIERYKIDFNKKEVYVSEAVMCFDGYFVKGEYKGRH